MGGSECTPSAAAKARGSQLYAQGDYAAAEEAFSEALRFAGPEDQAELHVYHSNRCAARQQLGNLQGAVEDAQKCTLLAPSWAKGWSRLGSCMLQQAKHAQAIDAFRKASQLEPSNTTYAAQAKNAQEALRRAPPASGGSGNASTSRPSRTSSGPGLSERVSATLGRQVIALQQWWSNLTPDQQKLLVAGSAVAVLYILYYIYQMFFSYSYIMEEPVYYGGHSGWTWSFWLLVLGALWQGPPMFGYQPFFGMSFFQVIWLLQMLQGNSGGRPYGGYTRRRRW